jgi:hypothetical protein
VGRTVDSTGRPAGIIVHVVVQVTGAWNWALLVHVFSWYMQIHPGHAILEGRKPALLDSLGQVGTSRGQESSSRANLHLLRLSECLQELGVSH